MNQNDNEITKELRNIAWVLVLGTMAPMLDSTMVNIALNQLKMGFATSLATAQWTVTIFTLAMGTAVPLSGWLINRWSGKKVYLWAEVAFGVTSFFSGISWSVQALIFFRMLQGLSAGLILPLLTTLLVDSAGADKMGRMMAIIGVPMTLGPMLGPVLGGFIVQYASWRLIFLINVPVVVISILMIKKVVPNDQPKDKNAKLDWIGVTLLAFITGTIVYGITQASSVGTFNNFDTILYVSGGVLAILIYVGYAIFKKNQVVLPIKLFVHRNFTGSMIGLLLIGASITSGPMLLLPLFFQDVKNESVIITGLMLVPQSIGMLIVRNQTGKLIDRIGARWVVLGCTVVTILGTVPFMFFNQSTSYWLIAIILFIRGVGGAGVTNALMADPFVGLNKTEVPAASIGTRMFQQIGGGLGVAFLATMVQSYLQNHSGNSNLLLTNAYHVGFQWATVLVVATIIPALMLTSRIKLTK